MKLFSVKRVFLAAVVFTFGTSGSVEWSEIRRSFGGVHQGRFHGYDIHRQRR